MFIFGDCLNMYPISHEKSPNNSSQQKKKMCLGENYSAQNKCRQKQPAHTYNYAKTVDIKKAYTLYFSSTLNFIHTKMKSFIFEVQVPAYVFQFRVKVYYTEGNSTEISFESSILAKISNNSNSRLQFFLSFLYHVNLIFPHLYRHDQITISVRGLFK